MNYELVEISPDSIEIPERFRDDYGDISELAGNIEERGQLTPIILDNNNVLIDGHRRLLACKQLNQDVIAIKRPSSSFVDNKIDELVSNLHRKDFTWQEECDAVLVLHEALQAKKGKTSPGASGGWRIEDTAKLIGKSKGYTSESIDIADWKRDDPEKFKEFEIKEEARQYIKGIKVKSKAHDEFQKLGLTIEDIRELIEKEKINSGEDEEPTGEAKVEDNREGWIYLLVNPSLVNDLIKIGMTRKPPKERAKELSSSTGVPEQFKVVFEAKVSDCDIVEKIIHRKLKFYRHKDKKEFFNLPIDKATNVVKIITEQFGKLSQDVATELDKEG